MTLQVGAGVVLELAGAGDQVRQLVALVGRQDLPDVVQRDPGPCAFG
jgi:hypothetical protein